LVVVALLAIAALIPNTDANARRALGVSNMDGLHLQFASGTATPILMADQQGTGRLFELRDNATPVFSVDDGGAVTQSGAATLSNGLTVSAGGADVTGILGLPATAYALTGAQTITPTATYYELAPAAVLTATLAGGTAGDLLILANTVTTNTIIVDTGATAGGGNITLAENDIAGFIKVDDTWVELFSPDNS
jgi:hypothetical protein